MSTDPQVLEAMQRCVDNRSDPEGAHLDADELLCQVLVDDDHRDLVALYRKVRKWFA